MSDLEYTVDGIDLADADDSYLQPAFCVKCGKEFYPTPKHIYKDNRGRYCCWTCFNHRNDGKKSRWQVVECLYADGTVANTFRSPNQAAEWIGSASNDLPKIREACMNDTKYKGYFWRFKKDEVNAR